SLKAAVGSYINVSLYQAIDKVKVFQGDLLAFDGETLTIDYLDKTRHKIVNIPYQAVAKVRMAVKL
ncbi:ribosome maturation factor RimP, partial [Streptococcus pyogenes]